MSYDQDAPGWEQQMFCEEERYHAETQSYEVRGMLTVRDLHTQRPRRMWIHMHLPAVTEGEAVKFMLNSIHQPLSDFYQVCKNSWKCRAYGTRLRVQATAI